jgi:hypothetical protein
VVGRPLLKHGEDIPRAGTIDVVKERQWRGIIRDWQESGLNVAAYCQREKIKINQLSTWHGKIVSVRRVAQVAGQTRYC